MKKKKKILVTIITVIVLIILGIMVFGGSDESPYDFITVAREDIREEVSVTGMVKPAKDVELRFETGGTIERVYVTEGSEVKQGAYLTKLYTGKLYSQFLQAQASYNQAKAELNQFIAGATPEEIQVAERIVTNAEISLVDVSAQATSNLNEKYDDALVHLSNASSNVNIALADLNNLEPSYFSSSTAISAAFREKEGIARDSFFGTYNFIGARALADSAISNPTQENIDEALIEVREATDRTKDALDYTREAIGGPTLRDKVTAADQAIIDSNISNISVTLTNISTAQQAVSSQRVTNQVSINSAQNTLEKAKDDLANLKANPRNVDIAIYQARLSKAGASLTELQQKLSEATLKAPFSGIVSKVNVKAGEIVTAGGGVAVSLIAAESFQIEVDVPEVDIGKVGLNNQVEISLDAFLTEIWEGKVVEIEPAETIIDGVVYYRITVVFDKTDESIRSGMSADVTIKTNERNNVLTIPYRAVNYKDDKKIVKILDGEELKEIEVTTGLKGSNGKIEILTGVEEGDEIINFIKR